MNKIIVKKDNLYGIMDENGQVIVEPSYDKMRAFSNGFAAVCKDSRWGYINEEGREVIDLIYKEVNDFSDNVLSAVKLDQEISSWAIIKPNGKLIKAKDSSNFSQIYNFNSNGYAVARQYGVFRIIDENGNYANDDEYHSIEFRRDQGVFIGYKYGNACLINIEGRAVVDPEDNYDEIYLPHNGLCQVVKGDKMGYVDEAGKLLIPLKYTTAHEFAENGLAYVEIGEGQGGFINKKGEFVIPPIYKNGSYFKYGLASVQKDEEYIFIDEKGRKAFDLSFKYAGYFANNGLAKIELHNGRKGFINPKGEIEFIINKGWDVEGFIGDNRLTTISVGGMVGLINDQGRIVLLPSLDKINIDYNGNFHPFLLDGLWGYLDNDGKMAMKNVFTRAENFSEDKTAYVEIYMEEEDDIVGMYINDSFKTVDARILDLFHISFQDKYVKIYDFYDGLALAVKKTEAKIMNSRGKEIIPGDFELSFKDKDIIVNNMPPMV